MSSAARPSPRLVRRVCAASLLVVCATASNCAKPDVPPPPKTALRLSSFRSTGQVLSTALTAMPDVTLVRNDLGGSMIALDGLQGHSIDLGVATADVAYLAYSGQLDQVRPPFDHLRGLAVLGLELFHLLVHESDGHVIRSIGDLRGRKVARSTDAGTAMVLELLLRASGVPPSDVTIEGLPNEEVDRRLATGRVDAGLMGLSISPPPDHTIAAAKAGTRLMEIEGPAVEQLRLQHPFLVKTLIPRLTYPGQVHPIRTIGVDILLVCRADLDEDLVYRLMKSYFAVLARINPATDLDRAPAMAIPLHPGAVRYYRERELAQ